MDFNKLKLTDSQKACLIAVASQGMLTHSSIYERAFYSCSVLGLLTRGPKFTKEEIEKKINEAWSNVSQAVLEHNIKSLHDSVEFLMFGHDRNEYVYRLTFLGEQWIEYWKAKQLGEGAK